MLKIIEIVGTESWTKDNKVHHRTTAILEDGDEVKGYGTDFACGDYVERYYVPEWDQAQMRIKKTSPG